MHKDHVNNSDSEVTPVIQQLIYLAQPCDSYQLQSPTHTTVYLVLIRFTSGQHNLRNTAYTTVIPCGVQPAKEDYLTGKNRTITSPDCPSLLKIF